MPACFQSLFSNIAAFCSSRNEYSGLISWEGCLFSIYMMSLPTTMIIVIHQTQIVPPYLLDTN